MCKSKERKFWLSINAKYMSQEESDQVKDDDVLIKSRPVWRSGGTKWCITLSRIALQKIIEKLDGRHAKSSKQPKRRQVESNGFCNTPIPLNAPSWSVSYRKKYGTCCYEIACIVHYFSQH